MSNNIIRKDIYFCFAFNYMYGSKGEGGSDNHKHFTYSTKFLLILVSDTYKAVPQIHASHLQFSLFHTSHRLCSGLFFYIYHRR